jgi:hypothetical protein
MINTAPPRKTGSVAGRTNHSSLSSPIAEGSNSPVVSQSDSNTARTQLAALRGRHPFLSPTAGSASEKAMTSRKFSKSPIRGELVGRLSAAYEPNTASSDYSSVAPSSAFQSSLSAYTAALSLSASKSEAKAKKGANIEKGEPLVSTKPTPHSHASLAVDTTGVATDALVTPSSIRARSIVASPASSSTPNKASPLASQNRPPTLDLSPINSTTHGDDRIHTSRSSQGSATITVASNRHSLASESSTNFFPKASPVGHPELKKGIAIEKTTTAPPPPPPPPSPSSSRFLSSHSQSDMPNPMEEAVIKRELRQMETRLENYCNQRLEQWENRKRLSASSNNQSDTQHALDLQALQALRNELEESTRRQIKQTESRLEQYCNQRFEQMETKVNERLQQIRSSLEEFLIIAESEGIYPAPMEGSSSNHPTGTVGKGRNYG